MERDDLDQRLSRISTVWTEVLRAHGGPEDAQAEGRRALLERYQKAIYRYLLGALRDPDAADELFQEFALYFLRGRFRHADPGRGRFRDYVKTSLIRLVGNFRQRRHAAPQQLNSNIAELAAVSQDLSHLDQEFTDNWLQDLLAHTWSALEEVQRQTGQPFYAVLQFRTQHPDMPSGEMAKQLTAELKPERAFTDTGIRKTLQRARENFEDLLLDEIARSLEHATQEQLEEELIDLGLQRYCRSALQRRRQK